MKIRDNTGIRRVDIQEISVFRRLKFSAFSVTYLFQSPYGQILTHEVHDKPSQQLNFPTEAVIERLQTDK